MHFPAESKSQVIHSVKKKRKKDCILCQNNFKSRRKTQQVNNNNTSMCGMATLNRCSTSAWEKKSVCLFVLGVTLVCACPLGPAHVSQHVCDITRTRPYFVFCWKGNWSVLCFSTRPQRDLSRQVDV